MAETNPLQTPETVRRKRKPRDPDDLGLATNPAYAGTLISEYLSRLLGVKGKSGAVAEAMREEMVEIERAFAHIGRRLETHSRTIDKLQKQLMNRDTAR